VYAIQECATLFPGRKDGIVYAKSPVMEKYFAKVNAAEDKFFGSPTFSPKNVHTLAIALGDLNEVHRETLLPALESDLYVVFGASFIKGWLIEFLVAHKCINLHLGVSPYMRGASCNFWAVEVGRPDLVGGTAHLITKGLDSGPMLWHAKPSAAGDYCNVFEFTMSSVVAMHLSLIHYIKNGKIWQLLQESVPQDKSLEVRYSRRKDFNNELAEKFLANEPSTESIRAKLRDQDVSIFLHLFEL
jgi:methionyl-tRNA formyltransferase